MSRLECFLSHFQEENSVTPVRAVIYGVGKMGSIATRLMLEKGVEIVGAISRSPQKVGKDLGEITGLGRQTNVLIDGDARRVLTTTSPDIAVVTVSSYMPDMYEHFKLCLENGVNVVTTAEEALYPWRTSPMLTAQLDLIAKKRGVSIAGTGQQDVYWMNIASLMMGTAHRVDSLYGKASWNVDDYGPEVAKDQCVGATQEEFDAFSRSAERPATFGRSCLDALSAQLGLAVASIDCETRPRVADHDTYCKSLDLKVPAGQIIGFTDIDTIHTVQGPRLTFEMAGYVYEEGQEDFSEWEIRGEPNLRVLNPSLPTDVTTCTQLVNRIPDVINAEPGFVTVDRLPQLKYRAFPLGAYVAR
jgi:2,4-diaminopentanoate dehydrogenase